jgi:hypothetical protein
MKKAPSIFTPPFAGLATVDLAVRQLLSLIIGACSKSRAQIAESMSEILGFKVTVSMLNLWTAPSRQDSRFPCCLVSAFCEATGDDRLRRFLLGPQLCGLLEVGESVVKVSRRLTERRDKNLQETKGCAI